MCIFCKIINKEIPSTVLYETEDTIAILDLSQANEGHTLVMPKKHFSNMLETDPVIWAHVMQSAQVVAKAIQKAFNPDGINILNNCNEAAGQTVMHTHVHIIPRYKNDKIKIEFVNNEGKFDLASVAKKIQENI